METMGEGRREIYRGTLAKAISDSGHAAFTASSSLKVSRSESSSRRTPLREGMDAVIDMRAYRTFYIERLKSSKCIDIRC